MQSDKYCPKNNRDGHRHEPKPKSGLDLALFGVCELRLTDHAVPNIHGASVVLLQAFTPPMLISLLGDVGHHLEVTRVTWHAHSGYCRGHQGQPPLPSWSGMSASWACLHHFWVMQACWGQHLMSPRNDVSLSGCYMLASLPNGVKCTWNGAQCHVQFWQDFLAWGFGSGFSVRLPVLQITWSMSSRPVGVTALIDSFPGAYFASSPKQLFPKRKPVLDSLYLTGLALHSRKA